MTNREKLIIWFIDEDERDLRTLAPLLEMALEESALSADFDVKPVMAVPNQEEYLPLINHPQTVGVIIDQRLFETGKVNYTGVDLAAYLRPLFPKLPIYILTAFPSDEAAFEEKGWSVENIFSKSLATAEKRRTIIERILRRTHVYQRFASEQDARFTGLLIKSLERDLSGSESEELETLRAERFRGIVAEELPKATRLMNQLEQLELIEQKIRHLEENVRDEGDR